MYKLDGSPNLNPKLTRDDGLKYYRQMQTIRRMEAAAATLYKENAVRGLCHLYTGQVRLLCCGQQWEQICPSLDENSRTLLPLNAASDLFRK